ncbi:hypothetical protein [Xanthomonas vesicatoria]|uniref:DNA-binding protein n=1 Tax=Xanthomonas vesicatoria TaxID=56460 RepID=A0ABS8LA12_9XANT|nr:hypothetical protein [Xanthomonas vesicatoria]APO93712.1 hypothetical protein BI313_02975 [Xanthomonas vesicatoria]MCC8559934.1 hypothetical protein [Xanthomonas vesicatoria]MCC8602223.1 hypothetical protein [Xanthomonas vesicatoria]MCC8611547.1 hypothetical protein [Xanthomonas vesicatoria]MCC8622556.1 hypothetical protein [Xanthomonas vesicatoria]
MSDERLSVPQDPEYFAAMGLATIAFARLEWNAVWCCERLAPGYLQTIEPKKKTAGVVARDLEKFAKRLPNRELGELILPLAEEFGAVVELRNGLLHARPGTAPDLAQRLFRYGQVWSIDKINEFSDRCTRAGQPLNALLHAQLAPSDRRE